MPSDEASYHSARTREISIPSDADDGAHTLHLPLGWAIGLLSPSTPNGAMSARSLGSAHAGVAHTDVAWASVAPVATDEHLPVPSLSQCITESFDAVCDSDPDAWVEAVVAHPTFGSTVLRTARTKAIGAHDEDDEDDRNDANDDDQNEDAEDAEKSRHAGAAIIARVLGAAAARKLDQRQHLDVLATLKMPAVSAAVPMTDAAMDTPGLNSGCGDASLADDPLISASAPDAAALIAAPIGAAVNENLDAVLPRMNPEGSTRDTCDDPHAHTFYPVGEGLHDDDDDDWDVIDAASESEEENEL